MPQQIESPVIKELLALDAALTAVTVARRHHPSFYEPVWRQLNERRNGLVQGLSQDEAAEYEKRRADRTGK